MDPRVPDREAFRIGEVADLAGVSASLLRYWETEFRQLRPVKTGGGQRLYRRRDVELVMRIRDLMNEQGFTIAGARRALNGSARGDEAEARREILVRAIRSEAEQLLQLGGK